MTIAFSVLKWLAIAAIAYAVIMTAFYVAAFRLPRASRLLKRFLARLNGYRYAGNSGTIFQTSSNNCGSACVEMVLRRRGIDVNERNLFDLRSMVGTSLYDLKQCLAEFKVPASGIKYDDVDAFFAELKRGELAIVTFNVSYTMSARNPLLVPLHQATKYALRGNFDLVKHWVVVDEIAADGSAVVRDPQLGTLSMSRERFTKLWNGLALMTVPAISEMQT